MQSPSLGRIRTADMLDDEASLQVTRYPDLEIYPCFFKTVESNTCNLPLNITSITILCQTSRIRDKLLPTWF